MCFLNQKRKLAMTIVTESIRFEIEGAGECLRAFHSMFDDGCLQLTIKPRPEAGFAIESWHYSSNDKGELGNTLLPKPHASSYRCLTHLEAIAHAQEIAEHELNERIHEKGYESSRKPGVALG
jgi:hypothetical protein